MKFPRNACFAIALWAISSLHAAPAPVSLVGHVRDFTLGPHGQIDGFCLRGGTCVLVNAPYGPALRSLVHRGERISVVGRPDREGQVHAQLLVTKHRTIDLTRRTSPPTTQTSAATRHSPSRS